MKYKTFAVFLIFVFLAVVVYPIDTYNKDTDYLNRKGKFIGESLPENEPKLFAPKIVSTGMFERDITFSPDYKEVYYRVQLGGKMAIITLKETQKGWTKPKVAEFSGYYNDMEPHISPNGEYLFFVSNRPLNNEKEPLKETNIWVMKRSNNTWSNPRPLGESINGKGNVYYPTATKSNKLYFTRREKNNNNEYIYYSELKNGKYQKPVKLSKNINVGKYQFNAAVDPEDKYIIVPVFGKKDSFGATDYYISFKNKKGKWGKLVNMGKTINTKKSEYAPYITPDGKYFFFQASKSKLKNQRNITYESLIKAFMSFENGSSDIYWISTDYFNNLEKIK